MAGFFLAGLVLVVILPSILARVVIFCAIAVGIIQALQLDAKSRMSSTIVMMAFFAAAAPQFMFLHSSESFIWAFGMMLKGTDKTVNFWDYAYQATFINLIYYALSMATVYIVKGRETLVSGAHFSTFIEQSCREMGPIQPREIKLLVLVFGIILGFMLEPLTHIDPVYVCCVLALLSYLPGINVLDRESFSNLNIVFLVFITGCMAIGFVGGSVGANKWAVASIVPLLQGWGETMSVVCAYAAGVVINFLLTPLAATAAFTPAFGELGTAMNVNPLPLFYAFNFGLDQYIFPYEAVYFLYIFITERVLLRHIVTALAIRMLIVGIFVVVVAVPYWNGIGLM
ncbi:MAG: anion permease [Bilophila wadsworthia]